MLRSSIRIHHRLFCVWTLAGLLFWAQAQGFAHRIAHGGPAPVDAAGASALLWTASDRHAGAAAPFDHPQADHHSCAAFDAAFVADACAVAVWAFIAAPATLAPPQPAPAGAGARLFLAYFSRAPPPAS